MTLYLIILLIIMVITVFLILWSIEVGLSFFLRIAPEVPSRRTLRKAVIHEIAQHYSDAKTAIDVGSGWGGMARMVGKAFPKMSVVGIECMPIAFGCSWVSRFLFGPKNAKFILGDAIKYIIGAGSARPIDTIGYKGGLTPPLQTHAFDIAICYSGGALMKSLAPLAKKFKIILSLDFPIPGRSAFRTIKLHKDALGQHYLYVYENLQSKFS